MHPYERILPVPYIKIDREGAIRSCSEQAHLYFNMETSNINNLIDEGSLQKFWGIGSQKNVPIKLEINMMTKRNKIQLFDTYLYWGTDGEGQLVLLPKDETIADLKEKLLSLQVRLSETNFDLLEQKEELENTLAQLNKLSGPVIKLTNEIALVPLFGKLTEEKVKGFGSQILDAVYQGEFRTLIFDFTAVSDLKAEGMAELHKLFQMLSYMNDGAIKIAGLHPSHAQRMNEFPKSRLFEFVSSLQLILQRNLNGY